MRTIRRRKKRSKGGLAGIAASMSAPSSIGQKHIAIGVLAAVAGNIIGAGLGKYSFWGGAIVSGIGIASKNFYLASAGAGMIVNTINKVPGAVNGSEEDMEGLSLDVIKDRMLHLASNYKNRMMLEGDQGVNGLGENDNVRYFHNPYDTDKSSLDLSELNRIHEQVASMNGIGLSEIDPTDRNF